MKEINIPVGISDFEKTKYSKKETSYEKSSID